MNPMVNYLPAITSQGAEYPGLMRPKCWYVVMSDSSNRNPDGVVMEPAKRDTSALAAAASGSSRVLDLVLVYVMD